jgi:Kae1-associated kinase Bud32
MTQLAHGAEAIITEQDNIILKDRVPKSYRHPELDKNIRKLRTRHEAKILTKLEEINFPAPRVIKADEKAGTLKITKIEGTLVKTIFDKEYKTLAPKIGTLIATLHNANIIHGDLTTSNMIQNNRPFLIDFGLSFISIKAEDKAVDLHLLERACESKHYKHYPDNINLILKAYTTNADNAKETLSRYEQVKERGRYKHKH